jgi:hypothetical protein
MPSIRIGVIDPPQSEKTNMEVPDDVDVARLLEAMVEEMRLPTKGPSGRENRYQLNLRTPDGRITRLDPAATLAQNGVENDAVLQLTVEMVAGGPHDELVTAIAWQIERTIADQLERRLNAVEQRLKVTIVNQRKTTEEERRQLAGTIQAQPIFGLPATDSQYGCDVFMLMPFSEQFQSVYRDYIMPVVESRGFVIKRGDDFFTHRNIIDDIWSAIARCRFIIADCTGRNANVFYELGIAHTLGKLTVLLTQDIKDLPFDIQGRRVIVYEDRSAGLKALQRQLSEAIGAMASDPHGESPRDNRSKGKANRDRDRANNTPDGIRQPADGSPKPSV